MPIVVTYRVKPWPLLLCLWLLVVEKRRVDYSNRMSVWVAWDHAYTTDWESKTQSHFSLGVQPNLVSWLFPMKTAEALCSAAGALCSFKAYPYWYGACLKTWKKPIEQITKQLEPLPESAQAELMSESVDTWYEGKDPSDDLRISIFCLDRGHAYY